jgi:hypothetical protein
MHLPRAWVGGMPAGPTALTLVRTGVTSVAVDVADLVAKCRVFGAISLAAQPCP